MPAGPPLIAPRVAAWCPLMPHLDAQLGSASAAARLEGAREARRLLDRGAPNDSHWVVRGLARTQTVACLLARMEADPEGEHVSYGAFIFCQARLAMLSFVGMPGHCKVGKAPSHPMVPTPCVSTHPPAVARDPSPGRNRARCGGVSKFDVVRHACPSVPPPEPGSWGSLHPGGSLDTSAVSHHPTPHRAPAVPPPFYACGHLA